jgi:hypothetical protein
MITLEIAKANLKDWNETINKAIEDKDWKQYAMAIDVATAWHKVVNALEEEKV